MYSTQERSGNKKKIPTNIIIIPKHPITGRPSSDLFLLILDAKKINK
jgi:hypothetical protein